MLGRRYVELKLSELVQSVTGGALSHIGLGHHGLLSLALTPAKVEHEKQMRHAEIDSEKHIKVHRTYLDAGQRINAPIFAELFAAVRRAEGQGNLPFWSSSQAFSSSGQFYVGRQGLVDDPLLVATHIASLSQQITEWNLGARALDLLEIGPGKGEIAWLLLLTRMSEIRSMALFEPAFDAGM